MQASEKKIIDFLSEDNELKLPIYQRNYEWDVSNCLKMITDLIKTSNYFLGLIVTANTKESKFLVDGQQRTTTFYIMLIALRDIFLKINLPVNILDRYLYLEDNPFTPKEITERVKIKSLSNDFKELQQIVQLTKTVTSNSNIANNYNFIYNYLDDYFEELSEGQEDLYKKEVGFFFEKVRQAEIVELRLFEGEDDAQQIFESLNSSGLKLNPAELIKNHILMDFSLEDQQFIHDKYWEVLESRINISNLSDFFRFYLCYKEKRYVNYNEIYVVFKNFYNYEKNVSGLETLLDEILYFSEVYYNLKQKRDSNEKVVDFLRIIDRIGAGVYYAFFFNLQFNRDQGNLSEEDFLKILQISESYFIRRYICDLTNQGVEALFVEALNALQEDFLTEFIDFLKSKENNVNRFPKNEEFLSFFKKNRTYSQLAFNTKYILYRMENNLRKEKINIESIVVSRIMPENCSATWKREIGANFEETYDKYLNSLGNLHLSLSEITHINQQTNFSNKKKFIDSRLVINRNILGFDSWTEDSIKEHNLFLYEVAQKIWFGLEDL